MPISFDSVSFLYSSLPLLVNVFFSCSEQERVCVVGPNGSGKTTLLRLANGTLTPDSGVIAGASESGLGRFDSARASTVGDVFRAANGDVYESLQRFHEITERLEHAHTDADLAAYDAAFERVTALGSWDYNARRTELLADFGLGGIALDRLLASLSPGQVTRVRLVALLLNRRGVLLLDEPTNYLDDDARSRLISMVRAWPDGVLFSSHDRDFIEQVATSVLDLDVASWQALAVSDGVDASFGAWQTAGAYNDYLKQKQRAQNRHRQIYARQRGHKKRLAEHRRDSETVGHVHFSRRSEVGMAQKFYADRAQKVSTRRKTNDDVKVAALAAREVRKPREVSYSVTIPKVATGGLGSIVAQVRAASVPGRLQPVTFDLAYGEKLLVTGANGAGKSTLLHWIATGKPPSASASGVVTAGDGIAYVPQTLPAPSDLLIPESARHEGIGEVGKGFLHPKFWATPLSQLSDGNQRRAQLAVAVSSSPNILVIDEPTNYLDLDFLETIEEAFREWNGTLIITTHDQWMIQHWQGRAIRLDVTHSES